MSAEKRVEDTKRVWRQSPGGKSVAVGGDVNERPIDRLQGADLEDPRIMELDPFLAGCLGVLPELWSRGRSGLASSSSCSGRPTASGASSDWTTGASSPMPKACCGARDCQRR
jgi:hypothetical protein